MNNNYEGGVGRDLIDGCGRKKKMICSNNSKRRRGTKKRNKAVTGSSGANSLFEMYEHHRKNEYFNG